jgi:hypothetical protein
MSVPANVAAARQQAITTDYYALGHLALCVASYADGGAFFPDKIKKAITQYVPKIGTIGKVPGNWTLDWGPAITANLLHWKANLLFAASYRDPDSNLPIFSAVVIRGTDTSAGIAGLVLQMEEDLEPGCQVPWPDGGTGACATPAQSASTTPYIARGTFKGFNDLIALTGVNQATQQTQTLADFLTAFLPQYADSSAPLPLVVTGHSLGGCQTSPIALYIASQAAAESGVTIVPHSFAAPTAGNQAFADLYLRTFPNARRWFNTFDLVPFAFNDLATVGNLWSVAPYNCGAPIPGWAQPFLNHFTNEVANLNYAHENGSATRQLTGACGSVSGSDLWAAQLEYQHFPPCGYWALMAKQYQNTLGSLQYPSWVTNRPACLG